MSNLEDIKRTIVKNIAEIHDEQIMETCSSNADDPEIIASNFRSIAGYFIKTANMMDEIARAQSIEELIKASDEDEVAYAYVELKLDPTELKEYISHNVWDMHFLDVE